MFPLLPSGAHPISWHVRNTTRLGDVLGAVSYARQVVFKTCLHTRWAWECCSACQPRTRRDRAQGGAKSLDLRTNIAAMEESSCSRSGLSLDWSPRDIRDTCDPAYYYYSSAEMTVSWTFHARVGLAQSAEKKRKIQTGNPVPI